MGMQSAGGGVNTDSLSRGYTILSLGQLVDCVPMVSIRKICVLHVDFVDVQ